MWILRWLFIFIILAIILGFALQNMDMVQVKIINWQSETIPLYWVVFAAFGLGVLTFMPIAVYHNFKHRLATNRLRAEIKHLKTPAVTISQDKQVQPSTEIETIPNLEPSPLDSV